MAKFTIDYKMSERGLPTLFLYQYFTIDKEQRGKRDYNDFYDRPSMNKW